MGDRHNIGLIQENKTIIWLYSHWGFYTEKTEMFSGVVAEALVNAKDRWDDESYFNRIFINTLGESLSGVSVDRVFMDEHKRYAVDIAKNKVYLVDNFAWRKGTYGDIPNPIVEYTFEDFVKKFDPDKRM